ncbi:RNA recognition motif protein [Ceratobasidium sp. AG-Ba]|nr:RNA recognition motif protein [Ceratobasidium sp. AG-Ba]
MVNAWEDSADSNPTNAGESKGNDAWGSTSNSHVERDPYQDRTVLSDHNIRRSVSPAREGRRGDSSNPGTNLHISGLHRRVTDEVLEDVFSKYGKVEKTQIVYDPHTKESRGFAFVMMSSLEEAETAISELNGYVLEGMALRVEKARRGRARTPTPGAYKGFRREYERPYAPRNYYDDRDDDRYYRRGRYYADYDRDYYERDRYGSRYSDGYRRDRSPRSEDRRRPMYDDRRSRYDDDYYYGGRGRDRY